MDSVRKFEDICLPYLELLERVVPDLNAGSGYICRDRETGESFDLFVSLCVNSGDPSLAYKHPEKGVIILRYTDLQNRFYVEKLVDSGGEVSCRIVAARQSFEHCFALPVGVEEQFIARKRLARMNAVREITNNGSILNFFRRLIYSESADGIVVPSGSSEDYVYEMLQGVALDLMYGAENELFAAQKAAVVILKLGVGYAFNFNDSYYIEFYSGLQDANPTTVYSGKVSNF